MVAESPASNEMKFVILLSALAFFMTGQRTEAKSETCHCGEKFTSRIVGGEETEINEWPWMAAIAHGPPYRMLCGGSVINDLFILTAAHCVQDLEPENLIVILGDHNITTTTEADDDAFLVSRIIVHSSYVNTSLSHDIALLKLKAKITFRDGIKPVCLPQSSTPSYAGKTAITTGWGATEYQGGVSPALQEVSLTVVSHNECEKIWQGLIRKMLCATDDGKSSCNGDSGGPLVYKDRDGFYDQIGIVSFGYKCGSEAPGVFTRVNKYLTWIKNNSKAGNGC